MKSIRALSVMKKHGLCHKDMRFRDLKCLRRIFGHKTWEDFIRAQLMARYLTGKDIEKPIIVPEVNMAIGGTLNLATGQLN